MLYQMLYECIQDELYLSKEDIHEKIVVFFALDRLVASEYTTLFNLLYPTVEEVSLDVDYGISTTDEVYEKEGVVDEVSYPMPEKAKEILTSIIRSGKMNNVSNKLKTFVDNKELTELECVTILANEDAITTIPLQ